MNTYNNKSMHNKFSVCNNSMFFSTPIYTSVDLNTTQHKLCFCFKVFSFTQLNVNTRLRNVILAFDIVLKIPESTDLCIDPPHFSDTNIWRKSARTISRHLLTLSSFLMMFTSKKKKTTTCTKFVFVAYLLCKDLCT